ncbi:MAG: sulfatase [Pirellulaceae bacterium]|jgi:N-sulfoglucosamine sulfohydrolase|nr:sulfatase [Pirellulaceae bacterium]
MNRLLRVLFCQLILVLILVPRARLDAAPPRPNILFCISDDQSYAHTGANGESQIKTPAFDRIAREGIRFTRAFCDAPTCGPSRSAILTGQSIWRLEEAGNIHSTLPAKFTTYTKLLQDAGYAIGFTGKGWSPGRLEPGGRTTNPAGKEFNGRKAKPPFRGMSNKDYAGNFDEFMKQVSSGQPFCFWLGTHEPHRGFDLGVGKRTGKDPAKVIVPAIFPDHPVVRNDLLDYFVEIEHFDKMVAHAIAFLEKSGQLENTIVVVTSDHGMPFPRAKASLYDAGTHVPLAIRWPRGTTAPGRVYDGLVNLSDLAPTFLAAAGLKVPSMMTAHGLQGVLDNKATTNRHSAYVAMERHDGCRQGGKGYPCRAVRTAEYLYIRNYEAGRWPAGNPDRRFCARDIPFGEVDSSPTKQLLMDNQGQDGFQKYYAAAFAKRPTEELYRIKDDPGQLLNLVEDPAYAKVRKRLSQQLQDRLVETKDPRALGLAAPWDYYPYYGARRNKNWQVDAKP